MQTSTKASTSTGAANNQQSQETGKTSIWYWIKHQVPGSSRIRHSCSAASKCWSSWCLGTLQEQLLHTMYHPPGTDTTRSTSSSWETCPGNLTSSTPTSSYREMEAGNNSSTRGSTRLPITTTTPFTGTLPPLCGMWTACQSGFTATTRARGFHSPTNKG
ncbi:unnamed protein product [Linum tenue]|uniref:Uncharacterized protein n=1 Tax=Linum tenue TaxID=586396 RepID=A0AAV0HXY0_9ROSI|nr:unnamed protein product [Linum tenue]